MRVSKNGVDLVAAFEGFRSCPYRDAVGVWTIGYGETKNIGPGTKCWSKTQAREALARRLTNDFGAAVDRVVKVPLNQNQFDALTSLAYNIGTGGFASSTVVRRLNAKDYRGAADAILMWDKAGGRRLLGLTLRRRRERALFLKKIKPITRLDKYIARLARVRAKASADRKAGKPAWPKGRVSYADRLKKAIARERKKKR